MSSVIDPREYRRDTFTEREDRLEAYRKERLKDDEFEHLEPTPFTTPHVSIEGYLQNKYLVLPDGTFKGFKIPINHITGLSHGNAYDAEYLTSLVVRRHLD